MKFIRGMASSLIALMGALGFGSDTGPGIKSHSRAVNRSKATNYRARVRNKGKRYRMHSQTPAEMAAALDKASARRARKAAFRRNQANYTNIRVRRQMV